MMPEMNETTDKRVWGIDQILERFTGGSARSRALSANRMSRQERLATNPFREVFGKGVKTG